MLSQNILGLISMALASVGYGSYIRSVVQGKTRPHIFSWTIWAVIMTIVFVIQMIKGAGAGAWVTGFSGAACLIIALLSIKNGEKNLTLSDKISFVGALLIIPVWYVTKDPLSAVLLSSAIDAFAYYPTFRKSYLKPFEEKALTFCFDNTKWIITFFAFSDTSLTTIFYPAFCFTANVALISLIVVRRFQLRLQA